MKQDIRELIIEELKKDLIGPRISEDETFWEYEGDKPTSRYISGVLYPRQTKLDQDVFLKNTSEGESGDDEEAEQIELELPEGEVDIREADVDDSIKDVEEPQQEVVEEVKTEEPDELDSVSDSVKKRIEKLT